MIEILKNIAKELGKAFIAQKSAEIIAGSAKKEENLPSGYIEKIDEMEKQIQSMEIRLEELEQSLKTTRLIAIISLGVAILIGILFVLL